MRTKKISRTASTDHFGRQTDGGEPWTVAPWFSSYYVLSNENMRHPKEVEMNKFQITILAIVGAVTLLAEKLPAQTPTEVMVTTADSITYRPHPTEKDARMAILFGNPAEAGYFLMRIEFPPGWTGPPHTHPNAELLMVRSGVCYVATGDDLSREAATELKPGSFAAVPGRTPMRGFAGEEPCVVDVQGQGPFTADPLDG